MIYNNNTSLKWLTFFVSKKFFKFKRKDIETIDAKK